MSTGDATPRRTSPVAFVRAHVAAIAELAWDHEPDWDEVYDGAQHDWCGEASREITAYLREHGMRAKVIVGGLRGNHHQWVELDDGSILDATIVQYIDRTEDRCVNEQEVPWVQDADGDWRLALIEPGHPLASDYEAAGDQPALRGSEPR